MTSQLTIDFSDPVLQHMNEEQAQVIQHEAGPLCVLAGAGSGKTRALVHRMVWLVKRCNVRAERIAAFTFTRLAADEMKARAKALGVNAEIRTWHSLAISILMYKDVTRWNNWEVDDTGRKAAAILGDILGYKCMKWDAADPGKINHFISLCKAQLWYPHDSKAEALATDIFDSDAGAALEAFDLYDKALAENRIMTYDNALVYLHEHLSDGASSRWSAKWDFMMQDEAQDANPAQIESADLLARPHRNYMVVGDPAQAIYGFRGSSPKFLLGFPKSWDARTITMNRNYRSGASIVDVANKVIRPSEHRLPTDLIAEGGYEGVVDWRSPETLDDEGVEVVESIKRHALSGSSYSDCVVVYRTNAQSRAVEEAMLSAKIPYIVIKGCSFYERTEVKDLLAYLRIVEDRREPESIKRAINSPRRYLGRSYIEKIMTCMSQGLGVLDAMLEACSLAGVQSRQVRSVEDFCWLIRSIKRDMMPAEALEHIIKHTGYLEWLRKNRGEESVDSSHQANVRELIRVAGNFQSIATLLDYIDLTNAQLKQNQSKEIKKDRCVLMSIHSSKGLEFKHVHLIGACELILPHAQAEDLDEERRLAYVGITRAKETLMISSPRQITTRRRVIECAPSRFMIDAGLTD